MDGAVVGRFVLNDKTAAIPFYGHSTYLELCSELCSRFNQLQVGDFDMTYLVPNHPPCLLHSDLDVRVLYLSVVKDGKHFVTITVTQGADNVVHVSQFTSADENEHLGSYAAPVCRSYLSHPWGTYINHVGQKFSGGAIEFRVKLKQYAVEKGFEFVYVKNDTKRVTAKCSKGESEGCSWRVHAALSYVNDAFYIRKLINDHTCRRRVREARSAMMSSKIVCSVIKEHIQSKPLMKPIEIVQDMKKYYGLDISYYHAWYGKELAKKIVHGDESLSYNHLAWYRNAVLKTNPGSHCVLECDPETARFKRFFISFHACIEGFKFCRPLLFLDGTFIKNKYKGQLLGASGKNGNQGMYPVAFAIVDSENQENWTWFLQNLSTSLADQQRIITFISDRQKGLLEAVSTIFPDSPHAFCYHHLKKNILSKYPQSLGTPFRNYIIHLFGKCAYAPTEDAFELHMQTLMKEGGTRMQRFLEALPKENWTNAYFPGTKYGEMCSNVAESFNAWIEEQRFLPVYQLVDGIRVKTMEMNARRRLEAESWNSYLCPVMDSILENLLEQGRHWDVSRSSEFLFEVHGDVSVMVDLQNWSCSCGQWRIKGFPCAHALAAVFKDGGNPFEYIEAYFTSRNFKRCYDTHIVPIPDIDQTTQESLEEFFVNPPLTRKPPGRPRVKRIRSIGEESRPMRCGRCGRLGHHNKKTCTAPI